MGTRVVIGNDGVIVIPGGSDGLSDVASIDEAVLDPELTAVGCAVGLRLVAPLVAASVLELEKVVTLVVLVTPDWKVPALDKTEDSMEDDAIGETEEGPKE